MPRAKPLRSTSNSPIRTHFDKNDDENDDKNDDETSDDSSTHSASKSQPKSNRSKTTKNTSSKTPLKRNKKSIIQENQTKNTENTENTKTKKKSKEKDDVHVVTTSQRARNPVIYNPANHYGLYLYAQKQLSNSGWRFDLDDQHLDFVQWIIHRSKMISSERDDNNPLLGTFTLHNVMNHKKGLLYMAYISDMAQEFARRLRRARENNTFTEYTHLWLMIDRAPSISIDNKIHIDFFPATGIDPTNHTMIPSVENMKILSPEDEEYKKLASNLRLSAIENLPRILPTDPLAKRMNLARKQILVIQETPDGLPHYRYCM